VAILKVPGSGVAPALRLEDRDEVVGLYLMARQQQDNARLYLDYIRGATLRASR
jgi:hypothetical protein